MFKKSNVRIFLSVLFTYKNLVKLIMLKLAALVNVRKIWFICELSLVAHSRHCGFLGFDTCAILAMLYFIKEIKQSNTSQQAYRVFVTDSNLRYNKL